MHCLTFLSTTYAAETKNGAEVKKIAEELRKAINPIHHENVVAARKVLRALRHEDSPAKQGLRTWLAKADALNDERSFVLLDEILRGTNSDDKRNGTIEFIKNIINKNAIGVIATHDIEVCLTTDEFPNQLTNRCFEVEISNDDLHFDYKLYNGICKNKSATFLMKKMGVI